MPKKGSVVLIPFPFTDLSASKVRPAVVVSRNLKREDVVVIFISSQQTKNKDPFDVFVRHQDAGFLETGLKIDSVIRVSKIATLDKKIILGSLGSLHKKTLQEIDIKIRMLFHL